MLQHPEHPGGPLLNPLQTWMRCSECSLIRAEERGVNISTHWQCSCSHSPGLSAARAQLTAHQDPVGIFWSLTSHSPASTTVRGEYVCKCTISYPLVPLSLQTVKKIILFQLPPPPSPPLEQLILGFFYSFFEAFAYLLTLNYS